MLLSFHSRIPVAPRCEGWFRRPRCRFYLFPMETSSTNSRKTMGCIVLCSNSAWNKFCSGYVMLDAIQIEHVFSLSEKSASEKTLREPILWMSGVFVRCMPSWTNSGGILEAIEAKVRFKWPQLWNPKERASGSRDSLDWSWFLPSNIGLSCKFSHNPILWVMTWNGYGWIWNMEWIWNQKRTWLVLLESEKLIPLYIYIYMESPPLPKNGPNG